MAATASIDSLIQESGDCGLFQTFLVVALHGAVVVSEWSTMFMAYGNYNPGWTCNDTALPDSNVLRNVRFEKRYNLSAREINFNSSRSGDEISDDSCQGYRNCRRVVYSQQASTVLTEWDLACDRSWILSLMLSVQGGGYLLGTYAAGFLSDKIGRKPTHFWAMALHAALNLAAIISVNWPMFVAMRLVIGITSGLINITNYVYPMEFVTDKWRAIVTSLPFTSIATLIFALTAMLFRDWRVLHLATAALTLAMFLFVICVPESIRWYAMKGRSEEAIAVVHTMAKWNGIKSPEDVDLDVIYAIAKEEEKNGKAGEGYGVLDLFCKELLKRTLILMYSWVWIFMTNTIVFFNIKSLSGNIYMNLIYFSILGMASLPLVSALTTSLGRKRGLVLILAIASLCAIPLVFLEFVEQTASVGMAIMILSLVLLVAVEAVWSIVMLCCVELYPTGLRSLSYSFTVGIGRVAGMVAPFLIPFDESTQYITNIVIAVFTLVAFISVFYLPETKGQPLIDYMKLKGDK